MWQQNYTVTWMNGSTQLEKDTDVAKNSQPSYDGSTPTRDADDDFTYEFVGWSDVADDKAENAQSADKLPKVTSNATYYAIFKKVAVPKVYVEVTKEWNDSNYFENNKAIDNYKRPDTVTVILTAKDEDDNVVSLTNNSKVIDIKGGKTSVKFEDLRTTTAEGKAIKYSVEEADLPGYTAEVGALTEVNNSDGDLEGYSVTITNTPAEDKSVNGVTLTIHKTDTEGNSLTGVTFSVVKTVNGKPSGRMSNTSPTNNEGKTTWTFNEAGTYTVKEMLPPEGYKASDTSWTFTVSEDFEKIELESSVWTWLYNLVLGNNDGSYDRSKRTLTVKNTPKDYTVSFNRNGHGTAPNNQTVAYNKTATEPDAPTETGYTFGGWYTDQSCTDGNKYAFSTPVTDNITLYAKWTVNKYDVKYSVSGNVPSGYTAPVGTEDVEYGSKVTIADVPCGHSRRIRIL